MVREVSATVQDEYFKKEDVLSFGFLRHSVISRSLHIGVSPLMSSTTIRPAASPKKRGSTNSSSGSRATSPKLSLTESPKKKKKPNPPKQAATTVTTQDTDDEYVYFLRTYPQKIPQLPFPFLQIFVETNGTRLRVDGNENYAPLAQLARTVLTHLVESKIARSNILGILTCISDDKEAKKALATKLDDDRDVTSEDILNYLIKHTPTILVKELKLEKDRFVWGEVLKGPDMANELFVSKELASTCPPVRWKISFEPSSIS